MTINITTTHTITCEKAPVEDVLNLVYTDALDDANETSFRVYTRTQIDDLTAERNELQGKVADLTRQRDEARATTRPALPEGMRIAEHSEYGRVVVSPGVDDGGDYKVFTTEESSSCKANYWYADPSELTFLDKKPAPAPLPKPEDCKAGELYLARALGREVVAKRCAPKDGRFPWVTYATADDYSAWCSDSQITLLSRILPDREVQA